MKDSEELFQLIKSLSGPEKRHFKLLSGVYEGDKNYLEVFNILAKQKNYKENALRKKIRDKRVLKQLPRVKNYLFELILKTMLIYHTGNSEKSKINNQVEQIRLLIAKGLFKQALKIISKSKKMGYIIGHYPPLLEIIKLERNILLTKLELEKIKALELESKEVWNHMQVLKEYDLLSDKMFTLISKEGKARNKRVINQAQRIFNHPLLANENQAINYNCKYLYFQLHSFYAEFKGDVQACYNYRKSLVNLMEDEPIRLTEYQLNYIIAINNLMVTLIDIKKYVELESFFQKLKSINPQNENHKMWIFIYSYVNEEEWYIRSGEFEKGILLEKHIIKGIEVYEGKIPLVVQLIFLFNLSLLNFGVVNYSNSLRLLNKAMNLPYTAQGQDVQVLSKIFNLIVHFELGNEDLLPYLLRSTYRYLLKQQRIYKYETFILQFIRKLPKIPSSRKTKEAFLELRSALKKLERDPFEKHGFGNFDIISWLESKIEKRNFAEIVKEKNA